MNTTKTEQAKLDAAYIEFCREMGIVMDSDADREDYAAHGHLFNDPGSDVHDHTNCP